MEGKFPPILYKFRNWDDDYHKEILTERKLYLSSPKDFNDPFDCRLSKDYLSLKDPSKMDRFLQLTLSRQIPRLIAQKRDINESLSEMKRRLSNLEEFQKEADFINHESQDKHYGIISFSARWDRILLWSHYGNNHKGFCVGLSEEWLRESEKFGTGGPVSYVDKYPSIDPADEDMSKNMFIETHTKSKEWAYEEEFRLTKLFYPKEPSIQDRKIEYDLVTLKEVYLGMNISEKNRAEILDLLAPYRVTIYQIVKTYNRFELDRKVISK